MTKDRECRCCQKITTFTLKRQLFMNGSENFVWVCLECDTKNPEGGKEFYIPREKVLASLTLDEVNDLPVIMPELYNRCAVCGARGTEVHHWAPRHLFGTECENWPKDHLCKQCHDKWHLKVTPNMTEARG